MYMLRFYATIESRYEGNRYFMVVVRERNENFFKWSTRKYKWCAKALEIEEISKWIRPLICSICPLTNFCTSLSILGNQTFLYVVSSLPSTRSTSGVK